MKTQNIFKNCGKAAINHIECKLFLLGMAFHQSCIAEIKIVYVVFCESSTYSVLNSQSVCQKGEKLIKRSDFAAARQIRMCMGKLKYIIIQIYLLNLKILGWFRTTS